MSDQLDKWTNTDLNGLDNIGQTPCQMCQCKAFLPLITAMTWISKLKKYT